MGGKSTAQHTAFRHPPTVIFLFGDFHILCLICRLTRHFATVVIYIHCCMSVQDVVTNTQQRIDPAMSSEERASRHGILLRMLKSAGSLQDH